MERSLKLFTSSSKCLIAEWNFCMVAKFSVNCFHQNNSNCNFTIIIEILLSPQRCGIAFEDKMKQSKCFCSQFITWFMKSKCLIAEWNICMVAKFPVNYFHQNISNCNFTIIIEILPSPQHCSIAFED